MQRMTPLSFSSKDFRSEELTRRRSATFDTYGIQQSLCEECLRREHLLCDDNRRFINAYRTNRTLIEQLRSSILLNRQSEEENERLKQRITQKKILLRDYQMNFNQLKQAKEDFEAEEMKQIRHEMQLYNQVIQSKQKHIDSLSRFRRK